MPSSPTAPNSRQTLIEHCLRNLGHPVIQINVDQQQCEDRLDEALQYFTTRHYDGVQKVYFKYQVTQTDLDRGYIEMDDIDNPADDPTGPKGEDIVSVVKVFRFGTLSGVNMFDVRYQLALTDYFGINRGLNGSQSTPLAGYQVTMSYISLLEQFFSPEKGIRFSKVTNKIYIDAFSQDIPAGHYLIIEAYAALDPDIHTKIYDDRLLKKYVTALIKRQWGANMMKYDGVQLPGGITFKGAQIYQEAVQEIALVEQEFERSYELPIDFMIG
jgi:hypothetical protein